MGESTLKLPLELEDIKAILPHRYPFLLVDRVVEVICRDQFHYLLLKGAATFQLPPGEYEVEAYRGLFELPAAPRT